MMPSLHLTAGHVDALAFRPPGAEAPDVMHDAHGLPLPGGDITPRRGVGIGCIGKHSVVEYVGTCME